MFLEEDLCLRNSYLYCGVDLCLTAFRKVFNSPGRCLQAGRQEELELGSPDSQNHAAFYSMEVSAPGSLLLHTAKQEV